MTHCEEIKQVKHSKKIKIKLKVLFHIPIKLKSIKNLNIKLSSTPMQRLINFFFINNSSKKFITTKPTPRKLLINH